MRLTALGAQSAATAEIDWEAFYADLLPRVYNYFRYRVGPGPLAEDLTATTFEKAWRGRQRYRQDLGAFSTWLFTIARRVAADHFRQRRPELPLDEARQRAGADSPEEVVSRRAASARLAVLLARLPQRERELIALKYGAGLTNRAIARLTRLSESNVGTLLHRAVRRLAAAWESEP
jgi:RNA polymerase sigma-70 factor (ECF subfamily)